jgi:hypothetical protein
LHRVGEEGRNDSGPFFGVERGEPSGEDGRRWLRLDIVVREGVWRMDGVGDRMHGCWREVNEREGGKAKAGRRGALPLFSIETGRLSEIPTSCDAWERPLRLPGVYRM